MVVGTMEPCVLGTFSPFSSPVYVFWVFKTSAKLLFDYDFRSMGPSPIKSGLELRQIFWVLSRRLTS